MRDGKVFCARVEEVGDLKGRRTERVGKGGWFYPPNLLPELPRKPQKPRRAIPARAEVAEVPLAPPEVRHGLLFSLFAMLPPVEAPDLLGMLTNQTRGFTVDHISARSYRTYRGLPWSRIAAELAAEVSPEEFAGTPGFGFRAGRPVMSYGRGIALPARGPGGEFRGWQVMGDPDSRAKGRPKYATISRPGKGAEGARAGILTHCSRPVEDFAPSCGEVILTEGILKADIISARLGRWVIASTGQRFDEGALRADLAALSPKRVIIAYDQDAKARTARTTQQQRERLTESLLDWGYSVRVAEWPKKRGKGLDDFLLGGGSWDEVALHHPQARKVVPGLQEVFGFEAERVSREPVGVEELRAELRDELRAALKDRERLGNTVLLVKSGAGTGKSNIAMDAAEEAVARDLDLRVGHLLPAHDIAYKTQGREQWAHNTGRTKAAPDGSTPCEESGRVDAFYRAGFSFNPCEVCRAAVKNRCKKTGYLSQQRPKPLAWFAANTYLYSDVLRRKNGVNFVFLDDVDLDSIAQQRLYVTERALLDNIEAARREGEDAPHLSPALPLLEFLHSARAHLDKWADGEPGELIHHLSIWAEEQGQDLAALVEAASTFIQPNPFADGARLDTATVPPRAIVGDLVSVLSHEFGLVAGRPGNTRLGLAKPKGEWAYLLDKSHDLAKVADRYHNVPIVILNADTTESEVRRWFPEREVRVIGDRPVKLPEGVTIHQDFDRSFCATDLRCLSEEPGKPLAARDQAFALVEAALKKHPGKIGVISYKWLIEREDRDTSPQGYTFRERFADQADRLEFLHFHNLRSQNTMEDVRALVIIGRPWPNEEDVLRSLMGTYANQRRLEGGTRKYHREVLSADGRAYFQEVRGFIDQRAQEKLDLVTRAELEQAVYRARPYNLASPEQGSLLTGYSGQRAEVDIYVYTSLPISLPVTIIGSNFRGVEAEELEAVKAAGLQLLAEANHPSGRAILRQLKAEGESLSLYRVQKAIKVLEACYGGGWLMDLWQAQEAERRHRPSPTSPPASQNDSPARIRIEFKTSSLVLPKEPVRTSSGPTANRANPPPENRSQSP